MRAAVVVILATITGIVALLNIKSDSVLNGFGAQAANNGAAEVVAVPEGDGGVAQGRVRPQVGPRPSRSDEQRAQLPARRGAQPLPKGCQVAINGEEITVASSNGRTFNLAVPENGTLTLRCEADGVRSARSGNQAPAPEASEQNTPGELAPDQGVPGQDEPGQPGPRKPKKPNQPPAQEDPANPVPDPQDDPADQVEDAPGS
jgi:hypothetical protein